MSYIPHINAAFDATPSVQPAPPSVAERARAMVEEQIGWLSRLAEVGVLMAEAAGRLALAKAPEPAADADQGELAQAYTKIARAVRLTVALRARALKEWVALEQAGAEAWAAQEKAAAKARAGAEAAPLNERRDRIDRIVRRAIKAERTRESEIEDLSREAWERLTDEDICGDIMDRPMGEVVAALCEGLGLTPDWAAMADEAWAAQEIRSGAPTSPFVKLDLLRSQRDP